MTASELRAHGCAKGSAIWLAVESAGRGYSPLEFGSLPLVGQEQRQVDLTAP